MFIEPKAQLHQALQGAVGHWKRLGELVAELSELPNIAGYSPVARSECGMTVISLEGQPLEILSAVYKILKPAQN